MNTQDMNRLRSEYRARIQTAAYRHPEWASREDALNYQQAAQICGLLADLTTGAEARSWAKKKAACQEKLRKSWTVLCPSSWKHDPDFDLDFSPLPEFSAQYGDSPNDLDIDFMRVADDACDAQAEETDEPAAADLNDEDACCRLGLRYYEGQGVKQDYARAARCFRRAAELGDNYAYYWLSICYHHGQGVDRDYAQAVECFRKAAELGDKYAYYWLGICYNEGQGVDRDYTQAAQWFRKAAELGDKDAHYLLGLCYYSLGRCYANGTGVKKNLDLAVQWYKKAAQQGNRNAQLSLALCYENGWGVQKIPSLAREWRKKALNNN